MVQVSFETLFLETFKHFLTYLSLDKFPRHIVGKRCSPSNFYLEHTQKPFILLISSSRHFMSAINNPYQICFTLTNKTNTQSITPEMTLHRTKNLNDHETVKAPSEINRSIVPIFTCKVMLNLLRALSPLYTCRRRRCGRTEGRPHPCCAAWLCPS